MIERWYRARARWARAYVSEQGHYSVERLAALESYCRTTSRLRVALVLLLTPWPAVLLIAIVELIPLQSPTEGWDRNVTFWGRVCLAVLLLCEGAIRLAQHMIPELSITAWQRLGISIATTIAYTGTLMTVADQWVFPVPFTLVVGAAPCSTVFIALSALAVGREALRTTPLLRERFQQFAGLVNVNMILLILYPAYNAIFSSIPARFRYVFVVVMPATRVALVNVTAKCCVHWPDMIPITAVLTVDAFNALFVAMFMQSSGRLLTMAIVLGFDAVYLTQTLYDIHHRLVGVRLVYQQVKKSSVALPLELLAAVRWLCLNANQLHDFALGRIRLFDSRPLSFDASADVADTLTRLHGSSDRRLSIAANARLSRVLPSITLPEPRTVWLPTAVVPAPASQASCSSHIRLERKTQFVQDTLQLLFHHEYIILAAYVKCFVPLVYVVTQSWLRLLPNAQYFPDLRSEATAKFDDVIVSVSVYAGLEILLLLVIHVVLRRRWGFAPLYQLAFALESHMIIVQIKLLTNIAIVYQFSLIHFGADFSFRFAWIHEQATTIRPPATG